MRIEVLLRSIVLIIKPINEHIVTFLVMHQLNFHKILDFLNVIFLDTLLNEFLNIITCLYTLSYKDS